LKHNLSANAGSERGGASRSRATAITLAAGIAFALPLLAITLHTAIRVIRAFYKFPMPEFLADLIDNPMRRRLQPPEKTAARHALEPGMYVLEVGPGNGTYTLAAARLLGDAGRLVAIDIEPKMVERLQRRVEIEGVSNVEARVADVSDLPFDDGTFDAIYMTAVIGEMPEPDRAMREFHRVLAPWGTLAFSEILLDPDYPRPGTLLRLAASAGFKLRTRSGSVVAYTLVFEKAR